MLFKLLMIPRLLGLSRPCVKSNRWTLQMLTVSTSSANILVMCAACGATAYVFKSGWLSCLPIPPLPSPVKEFRIRQVLQHLWRLVLPLKLPPEALSLGGCCVLALFTLRADYFSLVRECQYRFTFQCPCYTAITKSKAALYSFLNFFCHQSLAL